MSDRQAAKATAVGWDGTTYDAVSTPQFDAGARIVQRLHVSPGALIIDAGCGSGRVTELLLDAHPDARVIGIDVSSSMLAVAEKRLGRYAARVELIEADLSGPWPHRPPADVVVSASTFHWILDHDTLFRRAYEALKPGARLVAVTGGVGSLESVRTAARRAGVLVDGINNYAAAAPTAARLRRAGFVDVQCSIEGEAVRFPMQEAFAEYLETAALAPYEHGAEHASRVAAELADPVADFVRLSISARRPPTEG